MSLVEEIIKLRNDKKSYRAIAKELNTTYDTVLYHCHKAGLYEVGLKPRYSIDDELATQIIEYRKTHTIKDTANHFAISTGKVNRILKGNGDVNTASYSKRQKNKYTEIKSRRIVNKKKAVNLLGGGCNHCGYNKSMYALEFHHLDSTEKEDCVGHMLSRT